jgi:hypothetical protein
MRETWRVHKLTKDTNRICKIRSDDSQVDQSTREFSIYTGIIFELPLSGYPRYTVHRKLVFLNAVYSTKKPFTRFRYNQVSIVWHVYLIECLPVRLKEGFDYQRRKRWLWKHDIVYRGSCVVWLLVLAFPCPTN